MTTNETCETCRFSAMFLITVDDQEEQTPHMICRRYPPQMPERASLWPLIHDNEWCGEWAPKTKET